MIDWNKPIETVDGRKLLPANGCDELVEGLAQPDTSGDRYFRQDNGAVLIVRSDGTEWGASRTNVVVRNVTPPETPKPPCYDRLVALVGLMAETGYDTGMVSEARAIMAELRPVDPVILKARELQLACSHDPDPDYVRYMNEGAYDQSDEVQRYVIAIRFGMTLSESGK